ncbi:CotH kinase family protein [Mahella australiensis]|uniref:Spore coat protein CotH n=1 Tax=Mahella australiensis (strain DSM 15567 / CIP 107919 / 50-1 BON) TaxID=697281 RepID=F3ZVW1_MAHA5|nr:CotH kinase family protein [Mahella australiensis]AEE95335.1 Spore coat protein CotH [Mahella australiensis 50-1 BON]
MIKSKRLPLITVIIIAVATAFMLPWFVDKTETVNSPSQAEYVSKLFLNDIVTLDIKVNEDKWNEILENATAEEYIPCDITINGTTFSSVGIRPKGNSSLSKVASSGSDRYSFRLNFDKYVDGQTCFGLDTLILNNMDSDYTYVKEYFAYDIMHYMGVNSPLTTFADIKVNGKTWGLYLAVEGYGKSFLERTYGATEGQLYNVKSMGMSQDKRGDNNVPESTNTNIKGRAFNGDASNDNIPDDRNAFDGGAPGIGRSTGGDLVYKDDDPDSYSAIFDNAVFKADDDDYERVIEAIKHLNNGTELEKYLDVDQILRYLAVHTFVVNLDSYVSNMQQNYYLYENDGKITVLPWDYNLAFGGFQSGDVQAAINFPIDTPVSDVDMSQRPLINVLLSVPEYLEKYHNYLNDIVTGYFNSGLFEKTLENITSIIDPYVKNDPTAFCTYEQYKTALNAFREFCLLRAQSVAGQLSGEIPATADGQNADGTALLSADNVNLSAMGAQGGGRFNGEGFRPVQGQQQNDGQDLIQPQNGNPPTMPDGQMQQGNRGDIAGAPFDKQTQATDGQNGTSYSNNIPAIGALAVISALAVIIALRWPRRF